MKIAVLGSAHSWYVKDLQRAAGEQHRVAAIPFSALAAQVSTERNGLLAVDLAIEDQDAVLVRSMPPGSLEHVVFRMDLLAQLECSGMTIVNSPRAIEIAVDKYLSLSLLQRAGLPVPATVVCQSVESAMQAFDELGGDVVLKPLFGGEGRGISRLEDPDIAFRAFKTINRLDAVIYLQQFLPQPGFDTRVLVVGDAAWAIQRHATSDWRSNLSRGAQAKPVSLDSETLELARRAADAVGTQVAGVDLIQDRDGSPRVLEVNGVPGWRGVAEAHQVDIAAKLLAWLDEKTRSDSRKENSASLEPGVQP